jgi:hypothetical protein
MSISSSFGKKARVGAAFAFVAGAIGLTVWVSSGDAHTTTLPFGGSASTVGMVGAGGRADTVTPGAVTPAAVTPGVENETTENETTENETTENEVPENQAPENQTTENDAPDNQTAENDAIGND